MEILVDQQNFYLGCRVCRRLLAKASSVNFSSEIPDLGLKYCQAYSDITDLEVNNDDGLPERLCSDCAAKLTIAYQFKKDAAESEKILKSYSEKERSENDMYENPKFEEELFEYETLEELDESSQDSRKGVFEEFNVDGGDAVSFLTGILKPVKKEKTIGIRKISIKKNTGSDTGFDDPHRKHVCNVCNKKFQKRSNLIDHLRLHANVKVFSCEYCEKSFVQAGNYKAHIRTHTKEKPYACTICNKSYSQSSSLKIHIRSHTQEKNYVCEICDKGFTNASDLGKHKLIHDKVKRFRCDECMRNFTQKIHLRKHLEKHHPNVQFEFALKDSAETLIKVDEMNDGSKDTIYAEYEVVEEVMPKTKA